MSDRCSILRSVRQSVSPSVGPTVSQSVHPLVCPSVSLSGTSFLQNRENACFDLGRRKEGEGPSPHQGEGVEGGVGLGGGRSAKGHGGGRRGVEGGDEGGGDASDICRDQTGISTEWTVGVIKLIIRMIFQRQAQWDENVSNS